MEERKHKDAFIEIAQQTIMYHLRSKWLAISKMFNEMAQEYDGTISIAFVLLTLNPERGVAVTKIAPRMGLEPNSLSRIIVSMEKKGLIYRKKAKDDKRKTYINLTEHGLKMRELAVDTFFEVENTFANHISEEERNTFFKVMGTIESSLVEIDHKFRTKETID